MTKGVLLRIHVYCGYCEGTGYIPGTTRGCLLCHGTGMIDNPVINVEAKPQFEGIFVTIGNGGEVYALPLLSPPMKEDE